MSTKVIIAGKGLSPVEAVPWGRPDYEYWSFNKNVEWEKGRHFAKHFELHQRQLLETRPWFDEYLEHLKHLAENSTTDIIVWHPYQWPELRDEYPNLKPYPKKKVEQLSHRGDYHCGSFDWIVAYAVLIGIKKLNMYAMNLSVIGAGGEPISSRACLEYWIGLAEGTGMEVNVNSPDLFRNFYLQQTTLQYGHDFYSQNIATFGLADSQILDEDL